MRNDDLRNALRDSLTDGFLARALTTDPVTGIETTLRDLRDRDRRAREVAESLPPRRLRIAKLAYAQFLAEVLFDLTGSKCSVQVHKLPEEVRTGARSVAEVEADIRDWLDEMLDLWVAKQEAAA